MVADASDPLSLSLFSSLRLHDSSAHHREHCDWRSTTCGGIIIAGAGLDLWNLAQLGSRRARWLVFRKSEPL
jgi:hypothetical protein